MERSHDRTGRTRWRLDRPPWLARPPVPGRRVIVDNDFAGDPDGLVQLAHHLLSPSVEVRGIIASRLVPLSPRVTVGETVESGSRAVLELLEAMDLDAAHLLLRGSEEALAGPGAPRRSAGALAIVAEAMSEDPRPLVVACGAGLTELASAYLIEPAIADRLTAVWIGGPEYPGGPPAPPGALTPEYNVGIDVTAARVVLEDSPIPLWQVPRDVYRQCLVSRAELTARVGSAGPAGEFLDDRIQRVLDTLAAAHGGTRETFVLGDSPLVLLTALLTAFEPDTASSPSVLRGAAHLADDGSLRHAHGRPIRVYTAVDTRLIVEDLVAKLTLLAHWQVNNSSITTG